MRLFVGAVRVLAVYIIAAMTALDLRAVSRLNGEAGTLCLVSRLECR